MLKISKSHLNTKKKKNKIKNLTTNCVELAKRDKCASKKN